MDFVLKVGDLVALENGVMCQVLENVEYENEYELNESYYDYYCLFIWLEMIDYCL